MRSLPGNRTSVFSVTSAALAALVVFAWLVTPRFARAEPAPDFEAQTVAGDSLALSDFRGRVVLVEFWASWCPPCREQLPRAAALESELEDLVVLAVSVDTRRDRLERFMERVQVPRRVLLDPEGRIAGRFEVEAMPWAVLIGADGALLWQGSRIAEGRGALDDAIRRVRASD